MAKMQARNQSIVSYVVSGTTIFNTIILLLHVFFGFFFYDSNAQILFYYNFLSIATYLVGYFILYKNITGLYTILINAEVYIFMLLATVCLGWNYGFQQYCIIFVVSLLFTDYYTNQAHKLRVFTICLIALVLATYVALRAWTYFHPYVYHLQNATPERIFFIANSIISYAFLIAYSGLYSQTVFRLEQTLVDVATKDSLTGLYNRRKMHDLLNAMSELLAGEGKQMCIAMLDIDNFKKINDTYGHDAGDEVLKTLASVLLKKQAETDGFQACRWGGEEFLVFYRMNRQSTEAIVREFDELRQQIAQQAVICNEQEINVTVTTGLAFYKEGTSITDMIKLADDNLYEGKTSGKNVVIYKK